MFWLILGSVIGFFAGSFVTDQAWKYAEKHKKEK